MGVGVISWLEGANFLCSKEIFQNLALSQAIKKVITMRTLLVFNLGPLSGL